MTIGDIVSLTRESVAQIISLIAPILIVALIVGLIVAIFQAVTSIQEQTLTFLPKLLVILLLIALLAGTMFTSLGEFTIRLFQKIPDIAK
ncbi:MAG: flagellar biosynthesis protein FliQ [Treponema sp.]|nr:flagellar biosynthesis protein FliQ [Treponema sp.]